MSEHCSDEQLILHYYGDGLSADARAVIERHLAGCGECRRQQAGLGRVLAAVETEVPERGPSYGPEVWQRLRPRLPADRRAASLLAGTTGRRFGIFTFPRLALAGGVAALVLAAFATGRFWPHPAVAPVREGPATAGQVRERVLLVAVGEHLDRSQMVLVELMNAGGTGSEPADISTEQSWAQDLVASNRLYRQTAARTGEAGVESVLDELEPILLEIVHGPSRPSQLQLNELRERIEAQGILFKVRVIGSNVRERENKVPDRRLGSTS